MMPKSKKIKLRKFKALVNEKGLDNGCSRNIEDCIKQGIIEEVK